MPAFDAEAARPPSRNGTAGGIATAVSRAREGAKAEAAVVTAIGLILGFVIAWALFAFHKMNITDVLSHMDPRSPATAAAADACGS